MFVIDKQQILPIVMAGDFPAVCLLAKSCLRVVREKNEYATKESQQLQQWSFADIFFGTVVSSEQLVFHFK